jgi:DNA primase
MSLFDYKRRVERLKDEIPLANLFERDGIRLVKNGGVLKCCCPFHKEKTPSLVIYPDGHFHCFGCSERGDIFSYVMRRDGCSFKEAFEKLNGGKLNGTFKPVQNARQMTAREPELPKEYFHDMWARWGRLWGNEHNYLSGAIFAEHLGVLPETLSDLGLVRTDNSTWAFPMRDYQRRMIGIRLRDDEGNKFAVKGSKQGLFIPQSKPHHELYVTEGPTDCAALLSMGLYAIGKPAAMAHPDEIVKFIHRWRISKVIVIADNDRAGLAGAKKLVDVCPVPCCELVLPAKDARDFYRSGGTKQMIENLLQNAVWRTPK